MSSKKQRTLFQYNNLDCCELQHWPTVKLEDVTSVLGDGLHGTPEYDELGEYHFINGNNLVDGSISINDKTKRTSEKEYLKHAKPLNDRTILVSINGTLGNVALYAGEKVILGKSACYFNVLENVDKYFVKYVISNKDFQSYIHNLATGSTIKNVSLKLMRNYEFKLPSLEQQKAIASVLLALDDKIKLLRETNATLEAIAQALFKSWFVDFDPVHANAGTQAPSLPPEIQALFPATFTNSPQGPIPEGWKVEKFSSVIDKYIDNRGKTPPTVDVGIPLLEIKHLSETEISPSIFTEKKVDQETYDTWFRAHPEKNDILMSTVGTIGRLSIMGNQQVAIAQNILGLRVGRVLAPEFMYYLMKDTKFKEDVNARLVVTVQASIKRKDLETIDLLVPDTKIQEQFTLIVSSLIEQQRSNDERAQALASLRDTLLPRLISGQLRLREAEQAIAAITD